MSALSNIHKSYNTSKNYITCIKNIALKYFIAIYKIMKCKIQNMTATERD